MRTVMMMAAMLALAGCAKQPAVLSDVGDDSVKVQMNLGTTPAMADAEAQRGCQLYGKNAKRISYSCRDRYCLGKTVLYACIK